MFVLVADDEPDLLRVVTRMLRAQGHEVEGVGDGWELLRRASAGGVDAVVSDIGLPSCDGIAVAAALRRARPGLPLVLMTGDPESARRARAQGFPRVLLKPFAPGDLAAAIASF